MKKLILIFFSSISISVYGQIHMIGIQGGLNMTNLTAKETFNDTRYRNGALIGFNYEFLLSSKMSLETDVLFSQQGFKDKIIFTDAMGNPLGENDNFKFNYDYLIIPLKIGYSFGEKYKITPRIGICPSIILNAKTTLPTFDIDGNQTGSETLDVKNKVSKLDLSGLIEIEGAYAFSNNLELFSSIEYRHSITTFSNDDYFKESKMRHFGFSLSVGLKIKLKK